MAVPAIDAVVGNVMLMAERDRLLFDYFDVRDIAATVHRVGKRKQSSGSNNGGGKTDFRYAIGTAVEELGHPVNVLLTHHATSNCAWIAKNIIRRVSM
jgi:hypothetical protein